MSRAEDVHSAAAYLAAIDGATPAPSADTKPPRLRAFTARELWSDPSLSAPPVAHIWPLAVKGRVTILSSREKAGKSTLVTAACAAYTAGREFLGQALQPGRSLWLGLDEPLGDLAQRARRDGADGDRFLVLDERPESLGAFVEVLRDCTPDVVVIDTLSDWWFGHVQHEKDANEVAGFLRPYTRVVRETGVALVLLHHLPKAEGASYRGSTAMGALVDILATLKPPRAGAADDGDGDEMGDDDGRRILSVRGRGVRETLALSFDGTRYELGEKPLPLPLRILRALVDGPMSSNDLTDLLGKRKTDVLQEVQRLRGDGYVLEASGRSGWRISDSGRTLLRTGAAHALHLTGTGREPLREPLVTRGAPDRNHPGTGPEPLGNHSGTEVLGSAPLSVPDSVFLSTSREPLPAPRAEPSSEPPPEPSGDAAPVDRGDGVLVFPDGSQTLTPERLAAERAKRAERLTQEVA